MKQFTGFMHRVNLGGWFSQCNHSQERYDNFIKEEDVMGKEKNIIKMII